MRSIYSRFLLVFICYDPDKSAIVKSHDLRIELKYQYQKSQAYVSESSDNDRVLLGIREIQTIFNLISYFGDSSSLFADKKTLSLLDIGCGDRYVSHGCRYLGNVSYVGIDYTDCDIETESLPYPNRSFDVVICLALIEHLDNPSNLLSESYRVLSPGGILILSTPNWWFCQKHFYDDPTHVHPYTPVSLLLLLKLFGFFDVITVPNLRCKPKSSYTRKFCFLLAHILPFPYRSIYSRFIPKFLLGKASGIFGFGIKPST